VACIGCVGSLLTRPAATVSPPGGETYRTYSYDPLGNRLSEASDAGTTTYAYDAADRLTSVTPPGQSAITYSFDANGNQTAAGATTYTWDLADRLATATVGAITETYTYAGDGTRQSASTGAGAGQTTNYLWDRAFGLPQLALERDGADDLLRAYRYGLGRLTLTDAAGTTHYHHDGLGSVTDVTDAAGGSLGWSEYYPYGNVRLVGHGTGAPAVQPFRFTGEQFDSVTGLYHLRARQYDPGTGRFLTTDPAAAPIGAPRIALHVYAKNDPVLNADPSGHCVPAIGAGALAGAAGGSVVPVAGNAAGAAAGALAAAAGCVAVFALGWLVADSTLEAKPWFPQDSPRVDVIEGTQPDLNPDVVGRQAPGSCRDSAACRRIAAAIIAALTLKTFNPGGPTAGSPSK
jgi:RHS repeat-associated protein